MHWLVGKVGIKEIQNKNWMISKWSIELNDWN